MPDRKYTFAVGAAVGIRNSAIVGKVLARDAEPDQPKTFEVTPDNIARFEGAKLGDRVEVLLQVNAYQVEFTGDNGRPDSAWWQEDMLESVA